jgi:HK97 family phage prohead protease
MTPDHKLDATDLRLSPAFAFEAKTAGATGEIVGLASPFDAPPDAYGDAVAPGAFAQTLAEHAARGTAPVMLWSHDAARPIGRWRSLKETAAGLEVAGQLNLRTEAGREAFEHVRAGDVRGLSIGFRTTRAEPIPGGGRRLTAVTLLEISLVSLPAAPEARVREVKQLASLAELRDLLRDAGLARAAADRIARGGWPALAELDPETEARGALLAELKAATRLFNGA